jgi:hypothetical protein
LISHQDRSAGAKVGPKHGGRRGFWAKCFDGSGLVETTKTDSEVSISIVKCLKLDIFHEYFTKEMLQTVEK